MEDNEIVNLYFKRDENAIIKTAEKYSKYCYVISFNILHNKEDSEECINEAYLKIWKMIPPNYPNNFSTFLGKITRNISINMFKKYSSKKRGGCETILSLSELEECIPSNNNTTTLSNEKLIIRELNDFLSTLPKFKRIIFVKRYWYVYKINEISLEYNISESKVKSILFRIRKQLKNYLPKKGVIL